MSAFPQPEVVAPEVETKYYTVDTTGRKSVWYWHGDSEDKARLANYKIYLTSEAAQARFAWDLQETKKHTIPAWFRALGPVENIEMKHVDGKWEPLAPYLPYDWTKVPQELFRTKPDWLAELGPAVEVRNDNGVWIPYIRNGYRVDHNVLRDNGVLFRTKRNHVVKEINGVRFSWPMTVQVGDPKGPRHRIDCGGGSFTIASSADWCNDFGPFVHETREGAIEQRRALIAMAQ